MCVLLSLSWAAGLAMRICRAGAAGTADPAAWAGEPEFPLATAGAAWRSRREVVTGSWCLAVPGQLANLEQVQAEGLDLG